MRVPVLDGVRGIAVLLVVLFHGGMLPGGWGGVDLFFSLSGLLITGVLLDAKATGARGRAYYVPFYMRRALRIFPLAFLAALIVGVTTGAGWQTLWYVSYIQNWMPHPPEPRDLAHYWSLAVEEQFYLLWPWIVLHTSRRQLFGTAVAVVAGCVALRALMVLWHPAFATGYFVGNATFARADAVATGALLAILLREGSLRRLSARAWLVAVLAVLSIAVLSYWERIGIHVGTVYVVREVAIAALTGCVLLLALVYSPRWLRARWLRWIGTVSYGLYVIHGALPWFGTHVSNPVIRTAAVLLISTALAAVSWYAFESPILRLRSRWPMPRS